MYKSFAKYIVMLAGAALAAGFVSCFPGMSDNSAHGPLELSSTGITVGLDATKSYIGVTARSTGWTLTGDEDWCRADPASGGIGTSQVTVTFTLNDTENTRQTTFVFVSGDARKEIIVQQLPTEIVLPNQDPEYASNKAIHTTIIDDWYYWNTETESTPADYNQRYDAFFNGYLTHLTKNTLDGNTWSQNTERYLYSYITRIPKSEVGMAPLTYGMEFDVVKYSVNKEERVVSRILYVMDKSPAANAGLKRSDWFYKVNDRQFNEGNYNRLIDTLVKPVHGFSPKLGMLTFQSYASNLVDEKRTVMVTPMRFTGSPILNNPLPLIQKNHKDDNKPLKIGYLVYNSFDPAYESELVSVFESFKSNGLTDLILDLRYNRSGTVEMAKLMAELIVHPDLVGQTFARYEFNGKHAALNVTKTIDANPNSVGLKAVYILTSEHTAGAAELLINALRGLNGMDLVMIGDKTEGMNVGMVKRTYKTDEYQYDVYPAAFRCYNAAGQGDYQYGLSPNGGTVNEFDPENIKWSDTWGWKDVPGKTEDPILLKAMNFVIGNASPPPGVVLDASSSPKLGFPRIFSVQASMTMIVPE